MTKKTKKFEKENQVLKSKGETMNRNILEMAEECKKTQKLLAASEKKRQKLEDLCRALQQERNELKKRLDGDTASLETPEAKPTEETS